MAAAFDADAAAERGQAVGDGTAVHITIPTDAPWVPLRILALGKTGQEVVEADVYLLTDRPEPAAGARWLQRPDPRPLRRASDGLLADLRSDRGMEWVPFDGVADEGRHRRRGAQLGFDLAIDPTGGAVPSRVDAGLDMPGAVDPTASDTPAGRAMISS